MKEEDRSRGKRTDDEAAKRRDGQQRLRPRRAAARMADVAREAGVSLMTVSRALSEPDRVAPKTHQRIREATEKLGYVQDLTAQALATTSSRIVGVIVPTLVNPVFAEAVEALSDGLRPAGFQLLVTSSGFSAAREQQAVQTILGRRPDSVVLTGLSHTSATRQFLRKSGVPVFEMGNVDGDPIGTAVGASNRLAARALAEHLTGRGYRNIAFVGGITQDNDRAISRERGFLEAMAAAGLSIAPEAMIRRSPVRYGEGAEAMKTLLDRFPATDAVFFAVEMLAIGGMSYCQARGIHIPGQIAIACFDSGELSSLMTPQLTRVALPRYALGQTIAARILAELEASPAELPRTLDLGFELVVGQST